MTRNEFNKKWQVYIRESGPGMEFEFNDDRAIKYLDEEFSKEVITNPNFWYSQIKIKIGTARVYTNSSKKAEWEQAIDQILMGCVR